MEMVLLILAAAALCWWAAYARHGSLLVGVGAYLALGYVLGPPLWSANLGPLPLTADRVLLLALGAAFLWHWRQGRLTPRPLTAFDWLLLAALAYFTIRCAVTPPPPADCSSVKPWWRLIAAFWVPAALYLVVRTAPVDEHAWRRIMWIIAFLGVFLACTALAEITGQWWAVFPRYISDPDLGTHFGRARGPALNSASLGVMLTGCFWAAWTLWPRATRPVQLALAGALAAMAGGVYFTYTRSTWIGLAGGLAVVPLLQLPRQWRAAVAVVVIAAGAAGAMTFGRELTSLGRKDNDGDAAHSVYQRASFVYVSMRMFRDAPIFGCGFGRFYDKKLPYLADRSQQLELESLRTLDHHNTLLSVLVETGVVGLALFTGVLVTSVLAAWRLFADAQRPSWQRAQGLFALGTMIAYLASALFHDLTLLPTEQWLPLIAAGLTVSMLTEPMGRVAAAAAPVAGSCMRSSVLAMGNATSRPVPPRAAMESPPTVRLFGMTINSLDMPQAVDTVLQWCRGPRGDACRYVVTPNVDHAVMFQANDGLRRSYAAASLVLADGAPLVLASRLLGRPLPERVAGSDLAPAIFERSSAGNSALRVFLLGAAPGVADRAARNITRRWNNVEIVGTLSPPLGFEKSDPENRRILEAVAAAEPDLLILGLGAPKQELWMHAHAGRLGAKVGLCIGATIDFLAGEKSRAPRWMQRSGLEWLHRLSSEPRRLAKRYLRDAWVFPQLVWREWRSV
ncbi:MAG: hypothetical protein DCC67_19495 [Planctomycetota bacterium]|nr:MAG: hypothetical protein DCC67_19495 [Planctomycetota bacterium]